MKVGERHDSIVSDKRKTWRADFAAVVSGKGDKLTEYIDSSYIVKQVKLAGLREEMLLKKEACP